MPPKKRIDILLVQNGCIDSRERAQKLIMSGAVRVGTQRIFKSSELFDESAEIIIDRPEHDYVSRGGEKLAGALDSFSIDVSGYTCVDIGISTGGFTDCLLQRGAVKIYGIDVGYGQTAWKIRQDPRVTLFEKTNIREFDQANIEEHIDLVVIDVSFISLAIVLPVAEGFLSPGGVCVALIKPQFEVGREQVGKGGIVKDSLLHKSVITKIEHLAIDLGFVVMATCPSTIKGTKGNQEFFIFCEKKDDYV